MTTRLILFVVCCSAFGQMDTSTLRAKYGEPLARETFQVRPNIEAVVSYGTGHQVCKIDLPPGSYVKLPGFASAQEYENKWFIFTRMPAESVCGWFCLVYRHRLESA